MSDERHITRRASLRGIAATGALIGGTGLSAGTASASTKKTHIEKVDFEECHSIAVHLADGDHEVPITIRAYNADSERIENIKQTIKKKDLIPYELWEAIHTDDKKYDYDDKKETCLCKDHDPKHYDYDGPHVWAFSLYQFYDHAIDDGDKILSVEAHDTRIENTNGCAKKYSNEYEKKGTVDHDDIGLVPICVDSDHNTARYRVDNWNKKPVGITYEVYNTDRGGEVTVEPKSSTYFDVAATGSNGEATVKLYHDGERIETAESKTERDCVAADDVSLDVSEIDYTKRKVKFYLHDGTDFDRTFNYYVKETGHAGTITIHDDPASAETFWLGAPDCEASISLRYQGTVVGTATTDQDLSGPVVNKTEPKSYETIQAAVGDADDGDTIVVCEDRELDSTVEIDVPDLTLRGFDDPIVDGSGNSSVFDITADGVTIKYLKVTNPNELLGIRVDEGVDGATIRDNYIFEIGPTGDAGVTGILVSPGDHEDITIEDNTITELEQTDDGGFATLNGILFDAVENPGTISNVTIEDNELHNLDSTTAPLGIVVQHNVEDLTIKENHIKNLVADNDFGPGSADTFAQGISIDSPSTEEFEIYKNTIKNIESNDGFFGEDIKIESQADVSGIEIRKNNLLSAVGLNNADGDNRDVDAENNYWNSDDGPVVIENNEKDGTVTTEDEDEVDLDELDESAVTENVEFEPFAESEI